MKTPNVAALANAFSAALLAEIGAEQLAAVVAANATEENPAVCHSHDFIDANVVMADAWLALCGVEFNPTDEQASEVFDAAWARAKASNFSPSV